MRPLKALAAAGAAVALALSSLSAASAHTTSRNEHFLNLDTVKRIECAQPDGLSTAFGSGTIVAHNRVLTANHVVDGAQGCMIEGHPAKVVWKDEGGDVAVLAVNLGDTAVTQYTCDGYQPYQPYFAFGFAEAEDFSVNLIHVTADHQGMIKDAEYPYDIRPMTVAFGAFVSGMSGGPIMGMDGKLTGIVNASNGTISLTRDLADTALCTPFKGETPADPPSAVKAAPSLNDLLHQFPGVSSRSRPPVIVIPAPAPSVAQPTPKAPQTGSSKVGG